MLSCYVVDGNGRNAAGASAARSWSIRPARSSTSVARSRRYSRSTSISAGGADGRRDWAYGNSREDHTQWRLDTLPPRVAEIRGSVYARVRYQKLRQLSPSCPMSRPRATSASRFRRRPYSCRRSTSLTLDIPLSVRTDTAPCRSDRGAPADVDLDQSILTFARRRDTHWSRRARLGLSEGIYARCETNGSRLTVGRLIHAAW